MSHIIVAFSKRENAANIRNILMRSGMDVSAVCMTGAAVLQNADTWNEGIVICGCQMQDMQYTRLRELLPERFEMLLVAQPDRWMDTELPDGVVGLPMPVKVYDLISSVEMMAEAMERRRRKRRFRGKERSAGDRAVVEQAKAVLMERNTLEFRPESFSEYMQAPCGRLLVRTVLADLGRKDAYPALLKYRKTFAENLKSGCRPVKTVVYIDGKKL